MYFTKDWRRPRPVIRDAMEEEDQSPDVVEQTPAWPSPEPTYGCLVCGKLPSPGSKHQKCARCHCATYCSRDCQLKDYNEGGHKATCKVLKKLWDEKKSLEAELYALESPVEVGNFFHELPPTDAKTLTSKYYICLLNIVQILAREEGWRMTKTDYYHRPDGSAGNPLALRMALDVGLDLLHLERGDLRARLLIPPIYMELGMLQEAYDYLKFWIQPEATEMIMDLVTMEISAEEAMTKPFLDLQDEDMTESPETWIDFDMLYTSCGMVFELALLKLKVAQQYEGKIADELKRQVRLLLSAVHKLNPHLLPPLGKWDASSGEPAAVQELLMQQRPGSDLQCRMGNAGGRSLEEAVSIWQRDMVICHGDEEVMKSLASFCSNVDDNLVELPNQIDDADGKMREEAEALAARLQREQPTLSADGIMMHPEMAALMAKHLQQSRGADNAE